MRPLVKPIALQDDHAAAYAGSIRGGGVAAQADRLSPKAGRPVVLGVADGALARDHPRKVIGQAAATVLGGGEDAIGSIERQGRRMKEQGEGEREEGEEEEQEQEHLEEVVAHAPIEMATGGASEDDLDTSEEGDHARIEETDVCVLQEDNVGVHGVDEEELEDDFEAEEHDGARVDESGDEATLDEGDGGETESELASEVSCVVRVQECLPQSPGSEQGTLEVRGIQYGEVVS